MHQAHWLDRARHVDFGMVTPAHQHQIEGNHPRSAGRDRGLGGSFDVRITELVEAHLDRPPGKLMHRLCQLL